MITTLNPLLKRHIEAYIDDIEQGKLSNSILHCPIDVVSEYVMVLMNIDEDIPKHLMPFIRISGCLSSILPGGRLVSVTMDGVDETTFEFSFPARLVDYKQLQGQISVCCPHHFTMCNISLDNMSGSLLIRISISPEYKYRF